MVAAELSLIKEKLRDLRTDTVIPREEGDLLRLYYMHEREKLQLKLVVLDAAEKVKAIESAAEKTGQAEESLVKARAELQEASNALERLCRDGTRWNQQEASARKWESSREWQAITPDELQPAVEAIRHKFEHYGFWQSEQSTMKLCYATLHPARTAGAGRVAPESLAPYKRFLTGLLGRQIEFLGSDRPAPLIFKSYFDLLESALKRIVQTGFQELFEIAKARTDVLGIHPVWWTRRQWEILISAQKSSIRIWIKQVCDPLNFLSSASHDDSIFWGNWRAPRLIHMQPAGNTPFDEGRAWSREDLIRSEELLEGRAEYLIDFLRLDLDELTRAAHVEFVKSDGVKPRVSPPGERVTQTSLVQSLPSIDGPPTPDAWRSLHDRFRTLADEELTLAPQNLGDRWLRAYVDYKNTTKPCGEWHLSSSIHESFRERFEVEATRAGIALGSDLTAEPLTLWLHHLFSDLLQHKSKFLFAANEEGGIIVRVCEASALYSARLEKQALIEARKRPAENGVPIPVVDAAPTTPDDPRKETLREALIRKVKNPHLYNSLSTPEAAAYFEVEPRTIHRWIAEGDLRRGARRGSITIESVLRLEKSRSRKRPNR